ELLLPAPPFPFLAEFLAEPPLPPPPADTTGRSKHSPSGPLEGFWQAGSVWDENRATESVDCTPMCGRIRATVLPPMFGRPAMFGVIRGATGLMEATREPTLRLGVRMMLCA